MNCFRMNPITSLLLLVTIVTCCNGNAIRHGKNRRDITLHKERPCYPYFEICGRRDSKVLFLTLEIAATVEDGL